MVGLVVLGLDWLCLWCFVSYFGFKLEFVVLLILFGFGSLSFDLGF